MVEAQNAEFPQAVIVNVAFIQQNLAADHFIPRGGVAGEIDAAHEELFPLIGRQRQVDFVAVGDHVERGLRHEVDIAKFAVKLLHLLDAFAQLGGREDITIVHLKDVLLQEIRGAE